MHISYREEWEHSSIMDVQHTDTFTDGFKMEQAMIVVYFQTEIFAVEMTTKTINQRNIFSKGIIIVTQITFFLMVLQSVHWDSKPIGNFPPYL